MAEKEVEWYQDYKKVGHNDRYGKVTQERIQGGGGMSGKREKESSSESHTMQDEEDE